MYKKFCEENLNELEITNEKATDTQSIKKKTVSDLATTKTPTKW